LRAPVSRHHTGTPCAPIAPVLKNIQPYTPEIMGFLSGWGGAYSTYDAQGHLGHSLVPGGQSAINNSPNIATPGELTSPRMAPGENVNQPWLDAAGSGER
jgi:phospholipid/cholesterol/gamma-HCH transport system substrate-binding protein